MEGQTTFADCRCPVHRTYIEHCARKKTPTVNYWAQSIMASISVISCHSHVSRPCCMLSAPPHFFLFNCPASATRYSSDQRLRIVRANRIYISRLAEDCVGGLPGLLFCIQEARGVDSCVTLVGNSAHAGDRLLPSDPAARFQAPLG
jgi:hypothetical protein